MPRFSVIISVYNKEKYIGKTLQSVLSQTFQDFEIVVVNDGSTDGSEEVIKTFKDKRLRYYAQENKGASAGRNKAIQEAKGTYIALLDADDYWYPVHLAEIEKLIRLYPETKVYATAIEIEDAKGIYPAPYRGVSSKKHQLLNFFKKSYGAPILSGSSTVIHHSAIDKIGYFDEEIKSGQDTDYWIRLGLEYPVAFANMITARYTFVKNSLSQKKFNFKNKSDFSKFDDAAISNPDLAKYIAFNRFSLWMRCQMAGDLVSAEKLKKIINQKYLSRKQRLLLKAKGYQLRCLHRYKEILKNFGVRLSAFEK